MEEWPDYFEETFDVWGSILNEMIEKTSSEDPSTLIKVKKVAIDIVRVLSFRH